MLFARSTRGARALVQAWVHRIVDDGLASARAWETAWDQASLNAVIHDRADGRRQPKGFDGFKDEGLEHARFPDDPLVFRIPLGQAADGEAADCSALYEPGLGCPGCADPDQGRGCAGCAGPNRTAPPQPPWWCEGRYAPAQPNS